MLFHAHWFRPTNIWYCKDFLFSTNKTIFFFFFFTWRHLWDSVGHRDVGACSTGVQAQQPWCNCVHWGLQHLTEAGHVWREDKFSWSEAASEGWCGDALRRAALPRLQWDEPLQLSYLFCLQELSCGVLPQVCDRTLNVVWTCCSFPGLKFIFCPAVTVITTDQSSSCLRTWGTLSHSKAPWSWSWLYAVWCAWATSVLLVCFRWVQPLVVDSGWAAGV